MSIFNLYAKYYNIFYKDKDYYKEAQYLNNIIKEHIPKTTTLLELGCGTGTHAFLFKDMGYQVSGIDISEKMIEIAKETARAKTLSNPKFFVADIRDFNLEKPFDAIISLFHVISYQTSNADLDNVLKMVNKHLDIGGLFCFDCWYGPGVLTDKPTIRKKTFENEEIIIQREAIPTMFFNENRVKIDYNIEVTEKANNKRELIKETHNMRYLFKPEIEILANNNGLELIGCYDWLQKTEPNENSWNALFILKKFI